MNKRYSKNSISICEGIRKDIKNNIEYRRKDHPASIVDNEKVVALNTVITCTNEWDKIYDFFRTNKDINPYFAESLKDAKDNNCQSTANIFIITIEKLLNKISKEEI